LVQPLPNLHPYAIAKQLSTPVRYALGSRRSNAHIEARNQAGAVVAVADHIMKWL
jgi:hypothetical protein